MKKVAKPKIGMGKCPTSISVERQQVRVCETGIDVPSCPTFSDPAANVMRAMQEAARASGTVMQPGMAPGDAAMEGLLPIGQKASGTKNPLESAQDLFPGTFCSSEEGEQDVLLGLDLSAGVGSIENFAHLQTFTKMLVRRLTQNTGVRVGLLSYGNGEIIEPETAGAGVFLFSEIE